MNESVHFSKNVIKIKSILAAHKSITFTIAMICTLATYEARAISPEKAATSYGTDQTKASMYVSSTFLMDRLRNDDCFHINKYTGQMVPCDGPSSAGSSSSDSEPEEPNKPEPKAFSSFVADHNEEDFLNMNESVIPNAYLLSQLSAIAYRDPGFGEVEGEEEAYGLADKLGLDHLEVIEKEYGSILDLNGPEGESKAYIFFNNKAVFVSFEGSKGETDWTENNLDIFPHAKPEWGHTDREFCTWLGCYSYQTDIVTLHNGFYDAMDIIFEDVREAIESVLGDRKLWITGHSLGGAVALLTAFRLEFEYNIPVQGVHVFGAPAVGDSDWANVFNDTMSNVHRWGVEGDPAPVATQAPMFYHVGFINNLYTDGSLLLDGDESEMFGYAPQCYKPGYGAVVTHMTYWPRMHEELEQYFPELVPLFPDSLPDTGLNCWTYIY